MPTLPDYQAVGASIPRGSESIAQPTPSPIGGAVEGLGNVIGRIGEERYQQATNLAYATAKNEHLRNTIDLSNKVQENPDYNTWQKNFEDAAGKSVAQTAANIRDPQARQRFEIEAQDENIRTAGVLASRARQKFVETKRAGLDQTLDENSKSLAEAADPEARKSLFSGTNQIIDALAADGSITGDEARAKKKQFVEGFARNWADTLEPSARVAALENGVKTDSIGNITIDHSTGTPADFLPDDLRKTMIKVAKSDERQAQIENDKADEIRLRGVQDDLFTKFAQHKLTATDVLNSPLRPFGLGSKDEFYNMILTQQRRDLEEIPTKDDNGVVQHLFDRIHLPDGDPNKITDDRVLNQYFGHGVNKFETLNRLRDETQGRNTEAGATNKELENSIMSQATAALVKSNPFTGIADPNDAQGRAQLAKFKAFYLQKKHDEIAAGKKPSDLYDPASKDYLGRFIDQFKLSPQQQMDNAAADLERQLNPQGAPTQATPVGRPALPASPVRTIPRRNPGETPEQFLNRAPATPQKTATAFPAGMMEPGGLNPRDVGDKWATFEVAEDGIHKTMVLPTKPGDRPANDATGFLGDAVERWRKNRSQMFGVFEDEASAQAFMRDVQSKSGRQ